MECAILWRRVNEPGHDACRVTKYDRGWRLEGSAVFREDGTAAALVYAVRCDERWHTREATVRGWIGARSVDIHVARTDDGHWTLNDRRVAEVDGLSDVDMGFTPATNLIAIRRFDLAIGARAETTAAWLDVPSGTLSPLFQRYERRAAGTYSYESPRFGYAATLEVGPEGFPRIYPGLWEEDVRPTRVVGGGT